MEHLRWVLLAAGIIFVVFVYLYSRYQRSRSPVDDIEYEYDDAGDFAPELSTRDRDEYEEHISDVRIVATDNDDVDDWHSAEPLVEQETAVLEQVEQEQDEQEQFDQDEAIAADNQQKELRPEVIVLYVMAEPEQMLKGDRINSVARSNGLVFGDMNIFHRVDAHEHSVFSLANMVEPGSFDPDTLHTTTTPGLTFFMLPEQVENPSDAFDDMLQCAWRMSGMLGAALCNHKRHPMTEHDAEHYREIVAGYDGG